MARTPRGGRPADPFTEMGLAASPPAQGAWDPISGLSVLWPRPRTAVPRFELPAQCIAEGAITVVAGPLTLGVDAHREGRYFENVCRHMPL